VDTPADGDGEFFVLWLDDIDGGDGAMHNSSVPNIGVRLRETGPAAGRKNLFMARIGDRNTGFSDVELTGDRTYLVVGRLSKSRPGLTAVYDRFSLWVDPQPGDEARPLATAEGRSSNAVRWIGFSTGLKTEATDRVQIDELALAATWEAALELSAKPTTPPPTPPRPEDLVDFSRQVYPLLRDRCFGCHAGQGAEGGARLDVRGEILGHTSGNALATLGNGAASRLIHRLGGEGGEARMPPDEDPLSKQEIALLARWIDQGLPWDEKLLPEPTLESDHWAFQPIVRPPVPDMPNAETRTPIDAFLARAQREVGIAPNGPAESRTLIRRLTFDLTGLPPTPEDVDAFVNDDAPDSYERLVERLLASPYYGERWGRHWLDVARWAESNGYQHDNLRPHAWRYRDYVVRSFNDDKPYDRFLREQIAGDELSPRTVDAVVATGFLAAAQVSGNEMDEAIRRNDILVDIVNTTSGAVLGLTLQCAQCHNHKFDPVSARDYYRFQGFFVKGQLTNLALPDAAEKPTPKSPQTWGFYAPSTSPGPLHPLPFPEIRYALPFDKDELAAAKACLLVRGDVEQPGPAVDAGWPAVFGPVPDSAQLEERTRTVLVDWLTSPQNPLTARVWANRIWHYHFGRGLTADPGDFGVRTEAPLHQALLDWLAAELIDGGWSTKHLHRLICNSASYRRSAASDEASIAKDPDDADYWRWQPRRLEVEAIRDALLAVGGDLDATQGGPSVSPDDAGRAKPSSRRRTIYLAQKRNELPRVQALFDGPDALVPCTRRLVSTVPLQPLYLLNNEFVLARAESLARRVTAAASNHPRRQVQAAFRFAFGREPDPAELARSVEYLKDDGSPTVGEPSDQLIRFCHALVNAGEFVYLE
jgi:mono/diheme cytochrome c family protein